MVGYISTITAQLGISLWLLIVIIVWSLAWKVVALWKAARHRHLAWFIVFILINTVGILEILYIFIFSKTGHSSVSPKLRNSGRKRKSPTRKKVRRKRG